jgi:hypothetical protein
MFYMFSGPDFLYAQTFFPNADTYILCGIEPIGAIPTHESPARSAPLLARQSAQVARFLAELELFHHQES